MNSRNNAIVVWRIIFTNLILIYHFDNKYCISPEYGLGSGWYIGVEFFFIVSGYLLYTGMDKLSEKCHSGWDYFVYRYKKIYPFYLGAFLLSFISYVITQKDFGIVDAIKLLSNNFFEVFALHGIGLDDGWSHINNTSWYISIMFISGFIIFHCLLKWKDTFCNFVAPLIIMVSFSYLYRSIHCMDAVVQISDLYNNMALMRGLADMCLGIFAARLNVYIQENCKSTTWIRFAGGLGFVFVILCSLKFGYSTTDFLFALILTVAVATAFLPSNSKVVQNKFICSWSGLTMSLYLIHDAFRTILFPAFLGIPEQVGMKWLYLLLYLVVVTVSAIIFQMLISKMVKWTTVQMRRNSKVSSSVTEDKV